MKPTDCTESAIDRAVKRVVARRRLTRREAPTFLAWIRRDRVEIRAVMDPERAARNAPELFADWLRGGRAPKAHWQFWKLLHPRLRPPKMDPLQVYDIPVNEPEKETTISDDSD